MRRIVKRQSNIMASLRALSNSKPIEVITPDEDADEEKAS